MRVTVLSFVALALVTGCAVSTTANSITFKTQQKFTSQETTKSAAADYAGEEISVTNQNGDLTVEADGAATKVTVSMKAVAYADDSAHQADAEAVQKQVLETFVVTESAGKITISCGKASKSVGTSPTETSGCGDLKVKVPGGKGIKLAALSKNGSVTANGLAAADGAVLDIKSENGTVKATVTGSARVTSGNGDVTVSATPTKGSTLSATTENGDVELSLPANFAADVLALSGGKDGKAVKVEGFSDVTATSTSRGTKGEGAASITAKASDLGELLLKAR